MRKTIDAEIDLGIVRIATLHMAKYVSRRFEQFEQDMLTARCLATVAGKLLAARSNLEF